MSPEKRLLPFLEALAESRDQRRRRGDRRRAGSCAQRAASSRSVGPGHPSSSRAGCRTPRRCAGSQAADAVVQTSIGFETQGMTVVRGRVARDAVRRERPRHRGRARRGLGRCGRVVWAGSSASIEALAETLRRAAADIEAGSRPAVDPSVAARFRQSSRTAAMLEVYQRVLAA